MVCDLEAQFEKQPFNLQHFEKQNIPESLRYHNKDWNIYGFYQNTFAENDVNLQSVGVDVTNNIRFK